MNKKEKRLALKSALTSRVQENKFIVLDELKLDAIKTKDMKKVLDNLKVNKALVVLGEGSENARLALVGEAPGEQEALKGKPFVGKAGRNLDEFLRATGLERSQLYITNVVKIRPTRVSEAGRIVNRPPTREEIALFLPWLKRELAAVKAPVVVTLGNVALKALAGKGYTIGEAHGKLLAAEDMRIFPLYHPASVLYNPRLKEVYEQDLRALRALQDGN